MKAIIDNNQIVIEENLDNKTLFKLQQIHGYTYSSIFKRIELPVTSENVKKLEELHFDLSSIKEDASHIEDEIKEMFPFLFSYQVPAVLKAVINGSLLIADDVGLGKCILPESKIYLTTGLKNIGKLWETYYENEIEMNNECWVNINNENLYVYSLENEKIVEKRIKKLYRQKI